MDDFRNVLEEYELRELYGDGDFFTWANKRSGDGMIFERLDRFFTTLSWRLMYPSAKTTNLEFFSSDHRAIRLHLQYSGKENRDGHQHKTKQFRFEKYWCFEDDCKAVIELAWQAANGEASLINKIEKCKMELQSWVGSKVRSLPKKLKKEREKLNQLKQSDSWAKSKNDVKELEKSVAKLTGKKFLWK
ncbi:hypothetical protein DH2020_000372 [Rehmannia glutinosa]|uniref:Uncharacterized protein n=1 Tax=Rehmannia glutinosa TaxID=99300 RepID=A0ABR0XWQ4_REHGL